MRISEFQLAVAEEFGASYGGVLIRDLVLAELDGQTAEVALASGVAPSSVWLALCRAADVPRNRWHGRGRADRRGQ